MSATELVVGLMILVGLVGIVVPVLPGSIVILAAVLLWAAEQGTSPAWIVFAVVTTLLAVGTVGKYTIPARGLSASGVPNRTLWIGGGAGIVGFFVLPVVGLPLGFVAGVYFSEVARVGRDRAWSSTKAALKAAGLSVVVEFAAGLMAALAWLVGILAFTR